MRKVDDLHDIGLLKHGGSVRLAQDIHDVAGGHAGTVDKGDALNGDAAAQVRSGQVTYAARDSEFDGKKIKQGEYLSLSEGRLCASGRETSVLKKLVREMVSDDSAFATVIFGEGVTEEQAAEVENLLHKANKDMEISVINGGQPVYYYILSVE